MAKWGEGKMTRKITKSMQGKKLFWKILFVFPDLGDPRWIVEERPDATNVNNWHWKESNATGWSKDKLNELLLLLEIQDEKNLSAKIIEFERLQGKK